MGRENLAMDRPHQLAWTILTAAASPAFYGVSRCPRSELHGNIPEYRIGTGFHIVRFMQAGKNGPCPSLRHRPARRGRRSGAPGISLSPRENCSRNIRAPRPRSSSRRFRPRPKESPPPAGESGWSKSCVRSCANTERRRRGGERRIVVFKNRCRRVDFACSSAPPPDRGARSQRAADHGRSRIAREASRRHQRERHAE